MELAKKTTILFPPDLYSELAQVAKQRRTSIGNLVRAACRAQYSMSGREDRLALVGRMAALNLPVSSPAEMKRQSIPADGDGQQLLP